MARLIKMGRVDEFIPGQGKPMQVGGRFNAMGAVFPHEAGPLDKGEVDGDAINRPWHGYGFSVKTGERSVDSDLRVMTSIVKTQGDDLALEVA